MAVNAERLALAAQGSSGDPTGTIFARVVRNLGVMASARWEAAAADVRLAIRDVVLSVIALPP